MALHLPNLDKRIERVLGEELERLRASACPPRLAKALSHALFPAGRRARPRLCYAVSFALTREIPLAADFAAAALELVHCASLCQDDLPCFDNATTRRGEPSLHRLFGEALAVLAGDALLIAAFDSAARIAPPPTALAVVRLLARAAGPPHGLVAGQAWESEPTVDLVRYHHSKTAALFEAAVAAGALVGDADPEPWRPLGRLVGEAYQIADDISDRSGQAAALGKDTGQDLAHARPSSAWTLGLRACRDLVREKIGEAVAAIPSCSGREALAAFIPTLVRP